MTTPKSADQELAALVAHQAELLRTQAEQLRVLTDEVRDLRRVVGATTSSAATTPAPGLAPPEPATTPEATARDDAAGAGEADDGNGRTRRDVLRHAGVVAAGAAAGGAAVVLGAATPAAAATGTFSGNPGVSATGIGGPGVSASSDTDEAVYASVTSPYNAVRAVNNDATGTGVLGEAYNGVSGYNGTGAGAGVIGSSKFGYGVRAHGRATTTRAQLFLDAEATMASPPSRADYHLPGELYFDVNNELWACVVSGYPGTWRRLAGPSTAGSLALLSAPVRVYDSRPGNPPNVGSKTRLANGATRVIDLTANGSGVPVGATGVLANITVVNTSASGFLTAFKTGVATPAASTINWDHAGEIVANTTVVACNAAAQITCFVPPSSSTDLFIDVIGYLR